MLSDKDAQKLILENARLRENMIPHCRGCRRLSRHPCMAFYRCPRLGIVNPDTDGCSKKEE